VADRLSAEQIQAALADNVLIGRKIIVRQEVTSTNDLLWELAGGSRRRSPSHPRVRADMGGRAAVGGPEGLVIFAEFQSAGRGQRGNVWESSPRKGLWFSILLRPNLPVNESGRLTQWAVKMIAATIENRCLRKATIKPPNDVFVAERKIAGVLVEMRAQHRAHHLAIVGIGINVNQRPHDFSPAVRERAGSLAMLLRGPVDRNALAITLLRNLDASYRSGAL
jgi:BirA family transcriptional regulator, biotin operon repressor / biotin---[acetyl-CoA-carboxylase] ligase